MANPKTVLVDVGQLHFDGENPRHDPLSDEPSIIGRLYGPEKVLGLIKHVAINGVSPLDRIALIKHGKLQDHFTVVEGNRRLCALKLLKDPAKAPNVVAERAINSAKLSGTSLPKKLEAVLFADRASARIWMALRHEGEQDGAGTRKWDADQITRHNSSGGQPTNPNALSQTLLDYAVNKGLISEDERNAIAITTLTRYLTNPVFRDALGLSNSKTFEIHVDQNEFDLALKRFLKDATQGNQGSVNSRSNITERKNYAQALRNEGVAPTTRLTETVKPLVTPPNPKRTTTSVSRNSINPDRRPYVIPSTYKVNIKDVVLKRIFSELKTIDPDTYSFSAGYLLRAFIEQTAVLYSKKHTLGHSGELHAVIGRCTDHLEKTITDRKVIKPLRVMSSDANSRLSPDTLGSWVHGSTIPTGVELKRRWDTVEAGFKLMIEAL